MKKVAEKTKYLVIAVVEVGRKSLRRVNSGRKSPLCLMKFVENCLFTNAQMALANTSDLLIRSHLLFILKNQPVRLENATDAIFTSSDKKDQLEVVATCILGVEGESSFGAIIFASQCARRSQKPKRHANYQNVRKIHEVTVQYWTFVAPR